MKEWTRQGNLLLTLLKQQDLTPQDGAPIERWTPLHQLRLDTYKKVLRQEDSIHAFCEYRERQRNAQLGEPPTISELAEILDGTEQKNPEADKVSFSATPTLEPRLEPITTDFLAHR
jgi:1-deoxy-D-xylulose 5-phosphate reductoisomerase